MRTDGRNTPSEKRIFEQLSVARAVAALAVPTIISQLISMVYSMADTWFIGQTGDSAQVAAITLAYPVFLLLTAIANLFGIGGSSYISRLLGSNEREKAKRVSAFSFWAALSLTALLSLTVGCFCDPLVRMLGADESSRAFVRQYIIWTVVIGGVPTMLNLLLAHLIRSIGEARKASFGVSLGGLLNLVLDPLFIFGLKMNVIGAAVATCLANTVATVYFLYQFYRICGCGSLSLSPRKVSVSREIVAPILAIGFPSALSLLMSILSNSVLNRLISAYSSQAIAAVGIVKKADMIPTHITSGLSSGILPLLAYNTTSGNHARLKKTMRFSFGVSVSFALVCLAGYQTFAPQIVRLFINDAQTIAYGTTFMRLHCVAMPLMAATSIFTVFFQAAGCGRQVTLLSLLRKGVTDIPLMIVLDRLLPMNGVLLAQPIMDVISLLVAVALFARYSRRHMSGALPVSPA